MKKRFVKFPNSKDLNLCNDLIIENTELRGYHYTGKNTGFSKEQINNLIIRNLGCDFDYITLENVSFDNFLIENCHIIYDFSITKCSFSSSRFKSFTSLSTPPGNGVGMFTIRHSWFSEKTKFIKCKLDETVFYNTHFHEVNFNSTSFTNSAIQRCNIIDSNFKNGYFGCVKFKNNYLSNISFENCEFKEVVFENCELENIKFIKTQIEKIEFNNCTLKNIDWGNSKLRKDYFINIKPISFEEDINSKLHNYSPDKYIQYHFYSNNIRINDYKELAETYLLLKNQFRENGRYRDMSWAYLKEKESIRFLYYQEKKRYPFIANHHYFNSKRNISLKRKKYFIKHIFIKMKYLYFHSSEILKYSFFGYGEKPLYILGWSVFVIICFGLWFYYTDSIGVNLNNISALNNFDYFYFSAVTFTTLGFGNYFPASISSKIPVVIEALTGLFFYSLFIFSFGRRIAGR